MSRLDPYRRAKGADRGFTMVELLCAIVVLNLLVAGLSTLFRGQNQMVNSLEEWCEGEPVLYLNLETDPMARGLGVPATLTKDRLGSTTRRETETPYEVEIVEVKRRISKDEASAVFLQVAVEEEEGEKKKGSSGKGKKGKSGKKGGKKGGRDKKGGRG